MLSAKQQEALSQFRYLWRLDDKEWMKERKEQWKYLAENNFFKDSAKDRKINMRFFVKGERDEYISASIQLLLTPYDSAECVKEIFNSNIFTAYDRSQVMSRYIMSASQWGSGMPWLRQHIQWFVDGVLGHEYRLIEEQENVGERIISPDPTNFCMTYCKSAMKVLQGEHAYHGVADCVEYFISALGYATKLSFRKHIAVYELIQNVNGVLDGSKASDISLELARKIKSKEEDLWMNWNKNSHLD